MKYSVLICVYNGEKTIEAAIVSVLAAERPDVEIIVVDDASTDGTAAKLELFGNRIRILRNSVNQGLARSWGKAISASSAQFVIKLDADDWLLPNYFESVDHAITDRIGLVVPSVYDYVSGSKIAQMHSATVHDKYLSEIQFRARILRRIFFRTPGLALRRSLLEGKKGPDSRVWHDDWEFILRVTKSTSVMLLSAPLAVYRIHDGSMTGTWRKRNKMYRQAVCKFADIVSDPSEEAYLTVDERKIFIPALAKLYLRVVGSKLDLSQIFNLPGHVIFAMRLGSREERWRIIPIAFFPLVALIGHWFQRLRARRKTKLLVELLPPNTQWRAVP